MKTFRIILLYISFLIVFSTSTQIASAQCAMCSLNAENSTKNGNEQGKGLNNGILFLLSIPFILGGGIGILWYTKFRNRAEKVSTLE